MPMKKEIRAQRFRGGLCTQCMGSGKVPEGKSRCESCLEKLRIWSLNRSPKQRKRKAIWMDKWRKSHHAEHLRARKSCRQKAKRRAVEGYGGKCNCCGEPNLCFLTIDHKHGDGAFHRRQMAKGKERTLDSYKFHVWLIRNKFPKEFQILCFNCNCAKGTKKHCPHFYMKRKSNARLRK